MALQQQIQAKIDGQNAIDIGYWEALLQQLKAHMARARLRDRHQAMLRKKLFQLKVEVVHQLVLVTQIMLLFLLQEVSSSAANDNTLFPIATSGQAEQGSSEGDSEKPGTSGAAAAPATERSVWHITKY